MKAEKYIQVRAAFLMIVFSLYTIIMFICSIGINIIFNHSHHQDQEIIQSLNHVKQYQNHKHQHNHHNGIHHEHANKHTHDSKDNKDNCCKEEAGKLAQFAKTTPKPIHTLIKPLLVAEFISSTNYQGVIFSSQVIPNIKYFVRSYHPPIPDIRLAIQSFQI